MVWDENNFDDRLANLRAVWANGERIGQPTSENEKIWDLLSLELEFSDVPLAEIENVAYYSHKWLETKNPHYIDAAFLCCRNAEVEPPATLQKLMADVATTRIMGLQQSGTGARIQSDAILNQALLLVCNLHLTGATIEIATSKAARWVSDKSLGKKYKASTLEKKYRAAFRIGSPPLEDILRKAHRRQSPEDKSKWEKTLAELPEADDDLKGAVR